MLLKTDSYPKFMESEIFYEYLKEKEGIIIMFDACIDTKEYKEILTKAGISENDLKNDSKIEQIL